MSVNGLNGSMSYAQACPTSVVVAAPTVAGGSAAVSFPGIDNAQVTPALSVATTAGTIAAGAKQITITNLSGSVTATVQGANLAPGKTVTWSNRGGLGAVTYDPGSSGSLEIATTT